MNASSQPFTQSPRTREEHLAVVLVLGGPLGPLNTPEDFDALRERIYGHLDGEAFLGLVDLVVRFPEASERGPAEADEIVWTLSQCLARAVNEEDDRWQRLHDLLQEPSTQEVALGAIALRDSPRPIPWLEKLLTNESLVPDDREDVQSILARLVDGPAPLAPDA